MYNFPSPLMNLKSSANILIFFNHSTNKRQQADYHLVVIYISYGENNTSGVVFFRRFLGYKCQDMLFTHKAHQENIRIYMCV